jgi:hypothetical protein
MKYLSIKIIVSAGIVVNQTKVLVEIIRNLICINKKGGFFRIRVFKNHRKKIGFNSEREGDWICLVHLIIIILVVHG